jgi:hypothetical protein
MTGIRAELGTGDDAQVRALAAIARAISGLVRALEEYRDLRRADGRERSGTAVLRRSLPKLLGRVSALAVALLEEPAHPPS